MRLHDWQLHFSRFAKERAAMPFEWGRNDCSLFACDAMLAMTGADHAASFRGYTTAREALRLIQRHGGLHAIATQALGEAVSPLYAAVGDLVLIENAGRELLAICNGTNAIAPGETCMVALDMSSALAAWKV